MKTVGKREAPYTNPSSILFPLVAQVGPGKGRIHAASRFSTPECFLLLVLWNLEMVRCRGEHRSNHLPCLVAKPLLILISSHTSIRQLLHKSYVRSLRLIFALSGYSLM